MVEAITLAVIAKKAAELLASTKNGRKFIGYVIGIAIFIVLLPVIVLMGLFGGLSQGESCLAMRYSRSCLPKTWRCLIQ